MSKPRIHLVEPHSEGRISGGYLYNQKLSRAAPEIQRHSVGIESLARDLARLELGEPALVLLDSLFLRPELMAPFLALRSEAVQLGVVMHALPSFIERAGDRALLARSLPLQPTEAERRLLEQLDLLVAPGPYVPRLLSACGVSVRALICPPGVERSSASPVREQPSRAPVRIISLGSVTPLKGFADGLEALATLRARDWEWTIIGHQGSAPAHVQHLRRLAESHGLTPRVRFAGQRSHEETIGELQRSDLLLLPSYTENFPLVAVEALSAGVPVIGYEVGGVPDIVRHDHTGLLAPLLDVAVLAEHLARCIEEPATRRRMSRACAGASRVFTDWESSARQLLHDLSAPPAQVPA